MDSSVTKSIPTTPSLPAAQTTFIGREAALATIKTLLREHHLLTLTGGGGSGKTRLALAVAQFYSEKGLKFNEYGDLSCPVADFRDGVAWVDLAPLADAELVPQTVADALRLREQPDRSYIDLIADYLSTRDMLLVLDNCEHLRPACQALLSHLLQAGILSRVLATSREPLGVVGERVWLVPMLSVPATNGTHAASPQRIAELMQTDAVRLFAVRARAVAPAFTLNAQNAEAVAQICQRLDGMPLAIELAAARVNVLVPQQIVARLENSVHLLTRSAHAHDARHQTLRAALDWSFDLLPPNERAFFTRLATFAGSFGLDAVEGICAGDGLAAAEMLDLLAGLVEKSLVVTLEGGSDLQPEMRYRLLMPVRHYAAEHLRAAGTERTWRARHAGWYLELARRGAPELEGAAQSAWLDRLESEHDNLRAALTWYAAEPDGAVAGLQCSCAIALFWCIRSYLSEGQRWLETFLQRIDADHALTEQVDAANFLARIAVLQSNFQAARAHYARALRLGRALEYDQGVETGLIGMGIALWELGDFQGARAALEEAVAYARSVQHLGMLARALNNLGLVCMHQGDDEATRLHLQEGLTINQQLGNKTGIATVLFNLAMLAEHDGDYVRGRLLYEEALAIDRELGNRSKIADVLNNLGALAVDQADFATATARYEEAAATYRAVGAIGDTAYTSTGLGDVAFFQGDYATAQAHYTAALALFRAASNQRLIARVLGQMGRIACRQRDLAAAVDLCGQALTIRRTIGHKPGMIFILDQGFIELALATRQPTVAARILGAVASARRALARPREPIETRELAPLLAQLQAQLGDDAWATAWAEGEAMTLDEVVAYALETLATTPLSSGESTATLGPIAATPPFTSASLPAVATPSPRPELRVFALGQVRVYRGDDLITSADWTYAKARELFVYLLTHRPATREQIGLVFWPDASAAQVRNRFSVALAHARTALGRDDEWITLHEGRYAINTDRTYWYDVAAFESKLHDAAHLRQTGSPQAQIVACLEEAIALYQGDFAAEFLEGEWHQARRTTLARAYLDTLLTLGALRFDAEQYAQAAAAYHKALDKDPYLEEAHHALIRAYAWAGKRSQALRQYETLARTLAELNASPSPETQELVERVRRGTAL